jgi:pentatricopeptide repeat domain-containing protein 1
MCQNRCTSVGCVKKIAAMSKLLARKPAPAQKELAKLVKFVSTSGFPLSALEYSSIISTCAQRHMWAQALEVLTAVHDDAAVPVNVYHYNAAINACAKAGKHTEALELFFTMQWQNVDPDVTTYNTVISACAQSGEWKYALELLETMRTAGLVPDAITYSAAISACSNGRQWESALDLLATMNDQGSPPTLNAYNAAINGCAKAGKCSEALELLQRMEMQDHSDSDSPCVPAPDVYSYTSAMNACVVAKPPQWSTALELMEKMKRVGIQPNVVTYCTAMKACQKGGQWEQALAFIPLMRKEGVAPNSHVYTVALNACASNKAGRWEEALQLLSEMTLHGKISHAPTTRQYNYALRACTYASPARWEEAEQIMSSLCAASDLPNSAASAKPDATSFRLVMEACARERQHQRALSWFEHMRQQEKPEGLQLDQSCYSTAIRACIRMEEGQLTMAGALDVDPSVMQPAGINLAGERGQKGGHERGHAGGHERGHERGHEWDSQFPDTEVNTQPQAHAQALYEGFDDGEQHQVDALQERRDEGAHRALQLHREMLLRRMQTSGKVYDLVMTACERLGYWELALRMLRQMESEGVKPTAVAYVAAIGACEQHRY